MRIPKALPAIILATFTWSDHAQAQNPTAPSYRLQCWEAYQDAQGRWNQGAEKTTEEMLAVFAQTPGSIVCANFLGSGGSLNELFASAGVYCRCEEGLTPTPSPEPTPTPSQPPSPPEEPCSSVVSSFSKIRFLRANPRHRETRKLVVFGRKANLNQTTPIDEYRLELRAGHDDDAAQAILKECGKVAVKASLQKGQALTLVSPEELGIDSQHDRAQGHHHLHRHHCGRSHAARVTIDLSEQKGVRCELRSTHLAKTK